MASATRTVDVRTSTPPPIYVAGFVAGAVLELVAPIFPLSLLVRLGGGAIGIMAWLALDGDAMLRFRHAETSVAPRMAVSVLVTSGPYRVTRNPMYLGMAFLYVGLALLLDVVWSLAFLPVVLFIVDRHVIAREERYLEARFGDEYRAYRRRVRRWIPAAYRSSS